MSEPTALNLQLFFDKDQQLKTDLIQKLISKGHLISADKTTIQKKSAVRGNIPITTLKIEVNEDQGTADWKGEYEIRHFECNFLLQEGPYKVLTVGIPYSYEVLHQEFSSMPWVFVRPNKFIDIHPPEIFEKAEENCLRVVNLAKFLIDYTKPRALIGDLNIIYITKKPNKDWIDDLNAICLEKLCRTSCYSGGKEIDIIYLMDPCIKKNGDLFWMVYFADPSNFEEFSKENLQSYSWKFSDREGIFVCFDKTLDNYTNRNKILGHTKI